MSTSSFDHHVNTTLDENRGKGIERDYTPEDVQRLRGSVRIRHTLAELGAKRLWELSEGWIA